MALIVVTQTFLEDRTRFEEGRLFEVEESLAAYFVRNGWAQFAEVQEQAPVPPQQVTLVIPPTVHATQSRWSRLIHGKRRG